MKRKEDLFSKYAEEYDKYSRPQLEVGKLLIKKVNLKDKEILEVGCHAGKLSLEIAKKAKYVLGIDLAPNAIKIAKERARKNKVKNVEFSVANVENLKLNKKFDIVVCNIAFHVFRDKKKALREIKGVLKNKGVFVVNILVPGIKNEEEFRKIYFSIMDSPPYSKYDSLVRFPASKERSPKKILKELFEKNGFKILKMKEEHPIFWFKNEKDYIKHYEGSSPAKNYLKHLPTKMQTKAKQKILSELKKKVTKKGFKMTWGYITIIGEKK